MSYKWATLLLAVTCPVFFPAWSSELCGQSYIPQAKIKDFFSGITDQHRKIPKETDSRKDPTIECLQTEHPIFKSAKNKKYYHGSSSATLLKMRGSQGHEMSEEASNRKDRDQNKQGTWKKQRQYREQKIKIIRKLWLIFSKVEEKIFQLWSKNSTLQKRNIHWILRS